MHEREGIPERVALSDAEKVARWNILMRSDLLAIVLITTKHRRVMLTPELIEDVHTSFLAGMLDSMLNAGGTLPVDPTPEAAPAGETEKTYREALVKVMAHTGRDGFDGRTRDLSLANGLLDSIARIVRAALPPSHAGETNG